MRNFYLLSLIFVIIALVAMFAMPAMGVAFFIAAVICFVIAFGSGRKKRP